jgi:hypothetical protein
MEKEDLELAQGIERYVLDALNRVQFFEKLDDLLCPSEPSLAAVNCIHDYRYSKSLLQETGYDEDEIVDIWCVMRSRGGFCDCEILYNASESNRLKSTYWNNRATQQK